MEKMFLVIIVVSLVYVHAQSATSAQNLMTDALRTTILSEHNRVRRTVPGSNCLELVYDMDLETNCANYFQKLTAQNASTFVHNPDRSTGFPGYVGENWYSGSPDTSDMCGGATNAWVDFVWPVSWGANGCSERQNCQRLAAVVVGSTQSPVPTANCTASPSCSGGDAGHFTQVVWATTAKVGCAYCTQWGTLCDYYPGGNNGNSVYNEDPSGCTTTPCTTTGKATASQCPSGTTIDNGLCVQAGSSTASPTPTTTSASTPLSTPSLSTSSLSTSAPAPKPVNCSGSWSAWTACSATCGGGTQTSTYTIATPASNGGTPCRATSGASRTQSCNTQACASKACNSVNNHTCTGPCTALSSNTCTQINACIVTSGTIEVCTSSSCPSAFPSS